jgi:type IV secretion system protein VirB9
MRFLVISILALMLIAPNAIAAQKLASSDDRIKTLVYDSSEVFRVVTRSGFQTTIEFKDDETIDTISIGDSIGWQLVPAGKRLFVKPLHKSGITNLSVITNRRSYQFELVATSSTSLNSNNSYVVKFYYPSSAPQTAPVRQIMPEEQTRGYLRPVSETQIPQIPAPAPAVRSAPLPSLTMPLPGESPIQAAAVAPAAPVMNYSYTLSGPNNLAPVRVFDNGRSTYFQFGPSVTKKPQIAVVGADGKEYPLTIRVERNLAVVDAIAPKISIRSGNDTVYVYNETQQSNQSGRR